MISNSIKQIVLQHHERFDGSGFPYGIRGSKITTLSNVVGVADSLVHIIQDEEQKPLDALKILLQDKELVKGFNSRIIENLIKVFVDPPKSPKNTICLQTRVLSLVKKLLKLKIFQ